MEKLIKQLRLIYLKLILPTLEYKRILSYESEQAKDRRLQRKKRRKEIRSNKNFQKKYGRNRNFDEKHPNWRKDVDDMIFFNCEEYGL